MGVVLLAMFLANSPWGDIYASFWNYEVHLQIGEFNFFSHNGHHMTLMTFINDALMAVFFFSVGLEIKREILVGELSSFRQALLPIVAACGGMLVPVLIYYFMTAGTPAQSGLAIPMATDIAFSLGVLSLFGKRVPLSLKVFLTAFAVVDDIGGILELIQPLEAEGILVRRSREILEAEINNFTVLEHEGLIAACIALYPYIEGTGKSRMGEIACVATHPLYRGGKRASQLLEHMEKLAKKQGLKKLFVLTTQTAPDPRL